MTAGARRGSVPFWKLRHQMKRVPLTRVLWRRQPSALAPAKLAPRRRDASQLANRRRDVFRVSVPERFRRVVWGRIHAISTQLMSVSVSVWHTNKPAPISPPRSRPSCLPFLFFFFKAPTFLKFRFRVLFWRHSQTRRRGALNDQIRALPVSISSRRRHLRHWSQRPEEGGVITRSVQETRLPDNFRWTSFFYRILSQNVLTSAV